ncbi:MAG: preprotein translocase subunit SecY [Clostridia bacterium]|nr:preprotein translocase subunit SecY [Clostridia bacterium]
MLETIKNAWKVADLRKKILFTLFIILIFRIGSVIPVPFIDPVALGKTMSESNVFGSYFSTFTGGALQYGAIFAMGVTPYINSSIIMQLLTVAIPYYERISKEGEEGRKIIAKHTRVATVILGIIQGLAFYIYLNRSNLLKISGTFAEWFAGFVIVLTLAAGSALVMWLGEQIDEKGIGNGISILLFAGILSRFPDAVGQLIAWWQAGEPIATVLIVVVFLLVIAFIVWMTNAERRLPVQYAKRVVGRKMYGGQNTHIPIKVNMSGVMPIIFASSILMIPTMVLSFWNPKEPNWFYKILSMFSTQGVFYAVLYFAMIIAFAYFYVTIQYNPVEMANNLRKNSGSIPGIRPGQSTADFIKRVLSRITLIGAICLSVVAVGPILFGLFSPAFANISIGGTSVLIVVGVALEIVNNLESQMMMRHYKGFLD